VNSVRSVSISDRVGVAVERGRGLTRSAHSFLHRLYHALVSRGLQANFCEI
jgi:hypothetical protein